MSSAREDFSFLCQILRELWELCKTSELPVTEIPTHTLLRMLEALSQDEKMEQRVLKHFLESINGRLIDELSTKVFFQLPHSQKEHFEDPLKKWETTVQRFPESITDIEEASKCFALSRYAACVFHCVQTIEHGLLKLGDFVSVKDPISGWTAVANELKRIIGKKYQDRTDFEKQHSPFIEQMQALIEALKNAWRNKISHAHGQKLILASSDFTPDIAEEIMSATRAFMRRLAEELPQKSAATPG